MPSALKGITLWASIGRADVSPRFRDGVLARIPRIESLVWEMESGTNPREDPMPVQPVPDGHHGPTPYLNASVAAKRSESLRSELLARPETAP